MNWYSKRDDAAARAAFIAVYGKEGEELWEQIQELSKQKPLAAREVLKPRKPQPERDRPALQTEDSQDPEWWNK